MLLGDILGCGANLECDTEISEGKEIKGLTEDSRDVNDGYVYAAIKGINHDGIEFVDDAIKNGAIALIIPSDKKISEKSVPVFKAEDPRRALGFVARDFYKKYPENIVAVTGTNGKTSVAEFTRQIWSLLGKKSASIGTIGIIDESGGGIENGFSMTTPSVIDLHNCLHQFTEEGVDHIILEASSHGLDQSRLAGIPVNIAAFTNLSRDHLDYHKDMREYFSAKMRLFSDVLDKKGKAVLNSDIPEYEALKNICSVGGIEVIEYGKNAEDIKLLDTEINASGIKILISNKGMERELRMNLFGEFQVQNILCAIGCVMSSGVDYKDIIGVIEKIKPVSGRLEKVGEKSGGGNIFVDYAHTPDALEKLLLSIRKHMPDRGKLVTLFGCGGDRDKGKRPLMGKIASDLSDIVIITDDNPRAEDPSGIRADIIKMCPDAMEISSRREAIEKGVGLLNEDDTLVIAGKGHETEQVIGEMKHDFNDTKVAASYL